MKKILTLLALLAVCLGARAQQYSVTDLGVTNNLAGAATNAAGYMIGSTRYDQYSLLIKFNAMASSTDTATFVFKSSLDNTNWAPFQSFTFAAAGTTPIMFLTNITVGSIGLVKLDSLSNTGAVALTNIVIKVGMKPRRDG